MNKMLAYVFNVITGGRRRLMKGRQGKGRGGRKKLERRFWGLILSHASLKQISHRSDIGESF